MERDYNNKKTIAKSSDDLDKALSVYKDNSMRRTETLHTLLGLDLSPSCIAVFTCARRCIESL